MKNELRITLTRINLYFNGSLQAQASPRRWNLSWGLNKFKCVKQRARCDISGRNTGMGKDKEVWSMSNVFGD